jgi:hypothetical protein
VNPIDQIHQTAVETAGDISAFADIESVHKISQPLSDLVAALGEHSPDIDRDLGELTVRELHSLYFNIGIAVGLRDS